MVRFFLCLWLGLWLRLWLLKQFNKTSVLWDDVGIEVVVWLKTMIAVVIKGFGTENFVFSPLHFSGQY